MRRRSSLLLLGLLATGAGAQVAACSSTPTGGTASSDAGSDSGGGASSSGGGACELCCSGALPVMFVYSPNDGGTALTPDWTCYEDAGTTPISFAHPFVEDAGDDGAVDASDAAIPDAGTDAATTPDAGTDAGEPPADAGPDSGEYYLHLVDFSSLVPPIGATVDLFFPPANARGLSITGVPVAETWVVDKTGRVPYYPPPGQRTISYRIHPSNDAGLYDQEPLYWYDLPVVPQGVDAGTAGNGQLESNSITVSTSTALITSILGSQPPQANLGIIVTAARDCQGNDVTGAQLKLIDGVTGQDVTAGTSGPAAPVAAYFLNNIPDSTCTYTNNSGGKAIWSMLNAPTNAVTGDVSQVDAGSLHPYILQMYGRRTEADSVTAPPLISSVHVELYPGGNSIARVYQISLPAPNQ